VVCGSGSGERRSSPRGLRRWSGGIDEREKQMRGGEKEPTYPSKRLQKERERDETAQE
jgi:hypothetical protein